MLKEGFNSCLRLPKMGLVGFTNNKPDSSLWDTVKGQEAPSIACSKGNSD